MTKRNVASAGQCNALMVEAKKIVGDMNQSDDEMFRTISRIKTSSDETAKIIKTIEVRNLARRYAQAARETSAKIEESVKNAISRLPSASVLRIHHSKWCQPVPIGMPP